jgi:3-phenylpropionate/cinnamic acid dioxygenase small subunit
MSTQERLEQAEREIAAAEEELSEEHREPAEFQTEQAGRTEGLERIHIGDPVHFELVEFLEDEATALDDNELIDWFQRMAPDLVYRMPVRITKDRVDGSEFSETMFHFDEDYLSLAIKVTRLAVTQSAWAEKPPSRTRRFVTNIRTFALPGGSEGPEYEVRSSVLLLRNRYQESSLEILSVRRTDVIRRTEQGFKIAARSIFPDQATIGTQNLAVFL